MDLVTLALAKKYTDKKLGQGSGISLPEPIVFLAEMKLIDPIVSEQGLMYVDNNNVIYSL